MCSQLRHGDEEIWTYTAHPFATRSSLRDTILLFFSSVASVLAGPSQSSLLICLPRHFAKLRAPALETHNARSSLRLAGVIVIDMPSVKTHRCYALTELLAARAARFNTALGSGLVSHLLHY